MSGVCLTALGVAGLPNDLENWLAAFQVIGSDGARWIFVFVGLAVLGVVAVGERGAPPAAIAEEKRLETKHPEGEDALRRPALDGRSYGGAAVGVALRRHHADKEAHDVFVAAEAEIALANEEAREMARLLRKDWPYMTPDEALVQTALPSWRARTTEFIGAVLGAAQRAAFKGSAVGSDLLERLEAEGRFLGDLAINLSADSIRVNRTEFLEAREKRRDHSAADFLSYDHYRAPGAPPTDPDSPTPSQFGRRDDRGELAKRCHLLAGSMEQWVEAFRDRRSERVEKLVEEWLEADTEIDPAEARRKAYTHDEKTWETDYRLKYGEEARAVFRDAWELHEVAEEHEQLAVAPLAGEFEEVPKLFNTVADRLYRQVERPRS